MSKLANKVALVTGGSRGIGAAIAKRLAADGASVAITYAKDAAAASAVVKAIELSGGKAIAIQADAADAKAVKGAVEKAVATEEIAAMVAFVASSESAYITGANLTVDGRNERLRVPPHSYRPEECPIRDVKGEREGNEST